MRMHICKLRPVDVLYKLLHDPTRLDRVKLFFDSFGQMEVLHQ